MIRFSATAKDGRQIVGFGLSEENLVRLRQDKPVFVKGETVALPGVDLMIFWGATEYEMTEKLAALIGPETVVRSLRPDELPPDHPEYRAPNP